MLFVDFIKVTVDFIRPTKSRLLVSDTQMYNQLVNIMHVTINIYIIHIKIFPDVMYNVAHAPRADTTQAVSVFNSDCVKELSTTFVAVDRELLSIILSIKKFCREFSHGNREFRQDNKICQRI